MMLLARQRSKMVGLPVLHLIGGSRRFYEGVH